MAKKNFNTAASNEANTATLNAASANTELSAKDVALKSAAAKVEAEFEAKRKAELAAKAAQKPAKVIPEGTTGKALTKKARKAFILPEGYDSVVDYINSWVDNQSMANNQAALIKVARYLNRAENPSERTQLRREGKTLSRELAKLRKGIELLGRENVSEDIRTRYNNMAAKYEALSKRRTELAREAAAKAEARKEAKAARAAKAAK